MKALRQAMAWIHTWLGLLAGWILFAMFLSGTASYFRPEITRWMQPELSPPTVSAAHAAQAAVAWLGQTAPRDAQWTIILPDERTAVTRVFSRPGDPPPGAPKPKRKPEAMLDPATGAPLTARATRGGEHFYRFHFQLQIPHPWGRWLAGLCAIFMLTAIVSGVITHKRIFADFFTLRWGKGQRSWLDAHNATAVLALPFHAMITYTGLITLMAMYMPWPVTANYAQPAAFAAEASGAPPETPASGVSAPLVEVTRLVEVSQREWNGGRASRVVVRHPGDAAATVTVIRHGGDRLNARGPSITWSGASGARLSASTPPGPAVTTAGVMLGLHMGWFAGPLLRWTYFLLGLSGAAMVATGLVLWTAKRRAGKPARHFGFALVERLNIGAIAALPAGMAAFLLANRLIPAGLAGRADLEVATMFWTWFGLAALSCLRPARRAWIETLAVAAALFAAIPVVNALTTDRGLPGSVLAGDRLFAAFDLAMLGAAAILATAAWYAARPRPQARARTARARINEELAADAA
jgi:uncharacterized iron-regulated membrane protein